MSLLPLLFSNWWEHLERPHRMLGQDFGLGVNMGRLNDSVPKYSMAYYRPWGGEMLRRENGGASTVKADKDKFRVDLDVQQFSPDEINVKVVDHFVIVEGKHEEKQDAHGWISRQFTRKYMIPEQCDIDLVSSKLSSDGILSIIVPRKQQLTSEGERVINIEHTGKPAEVRQTEEDNKKEEEEEEKAE
nr:PREDICTED: protein lethal(2)essential for life-like [Megachile rotundata]